MNLVQEIVEILSDAHPNLENALVKTKVLLHRLGEGLYLGWVDKELNGYADDDEVPPYRVVLSTVKITASDGFTSSWNNVPAPLRHLDEQTRRWLERNELRQGTSSLESLARTEGDTLSRGIPPELWERLGERLSRGVKIRYAHCEFSKAQLQGVLTQIRSRLLDFALALEEKVPHVAPAEAIREISKGVHVGNLLNNAMFGPNTTIVIGDKNTQNLTFSVVQQGDFASLSTNLRSRGVSETDIGVLRTAIEADSLQKHSEGKQYGPRVKEWLKAMLSKAVEASWQVEIGVAGSLLANALQHYYGWF